jgi:hypothetical protein
MSGAPRALRLGVAGPVGTGKRSLIALLCAELGSELSLAVITNDIYTEEDARFLRSAGVLPPERIRAVETGACPHTAIRDDVTQSAGRGGPPAGLRSSGRGGVPGGRPPPAVVGDCSGRAYPRAVPAERSAAPRPGQRPAPTPGGDEVSVDHSVCAEHSGTPSDARRVKELVLSKHRAAVHRYRGPAAHPSADLSDRNRRVWPAARHGGPVRSGRRRRYGYPLSRRRCRRVTAGRLRWTC